MPEANPEREGRRILDAARFDQRYGCDQRRYRQGSCARAGVSKSGDLPALQRAKDDLFEALLLRESDAMVEERYWALRRRPARLGGLRRFDILCGISLYSIRAPVPKAVFTRPARAGRLHRRIQITRLWRRRHQPVVEFVRHFQNASVIRRPRPLEP